MFRLEKSLTFDTFVDHVMTGGFNVPHKTMPLMWKEGAQRGSSLMASAHPFYQSQLLPGEKLKKSQCGIIRNISNYFRTHDVACSAAKNEGGMETGLPLYHWCCQVLLNAVVSVYYGSLVEENPNLWRTFAEFDTGAWKSELGLPRFLSVKTYRARDLLVDAMQQVLEGKKDEMLSDLVAIRAKDLRAGGIPPRDVAIFTTMVFWA